MRKILLILSFSFLFVGVNKAQTKKARISFEQTTHDFGTIKEENGKVSYRFNFTNTGASPLILSNVKASCGCTTPKWTNTPVQAGEKGFIDVTFNPRGYRSFTKSIRVSSNGEPPLVTLIIKGIVEPANFNPATEFKYSIGNLKLRNRHLAFGKINMGDVRTKTIDVFNSGDKALTLSFSSVPKHLKVKAEPAILGPQKRGKIIITYNSQLKNEWDYVYNNIFVLLNGKNLARSNINISAVIKEDFTKLSPKELENAPVAEFTPNSFTFNTIKQGEKVNYVFKLKNTGKSPLIIRKVNTSCGCTAAMPDKKVINPGKTIDLKVTFNSAHKKGPQNKSITVITNDPKHDRKVLWLRGNVEVEE